MKPAPPVISTRSVLISLPPSPAGAGPDWLVNGPAQAFDYPASSSPNDELGGRIADAGRIRLQVLAAERYPAEERGSNSRAASDFM